MNDPTNPDLLHDIAKDYKQSSKRAQRGLSGSMDLVEKMFSRREHFLMEFLQNADDAGADKMKAILTDGEIRICNDGRPFTEDDVEAICSTGWSNKDPSEYIGYLGAGFKSVFLISEKPKIYSGQFRFTFDKDHWDDPESFPWQVVPIPLHEPAPDNWKTVFQIPFTSQYQADIEEKIRAEFDDMDPRTLMFLNSVKEIELVDEHQGTRKVMERTETKQDEHTSIHKIDVGESGRTTTERWVAFSAIRDVPPAVSADRFTEDWDRDEVEQRRVTAAFKIDDNENLTETTGTARMGVFSFMPLKEEVEGLAFLLQADFLTPPDRETIHREAKWNEWLTEELFTLIKDECIPRFKTNDTWKYQFQKFLTWESDHEIFGPHLSSPLNEILESMEILPTVDGGWVDPSNAVHINSTMIDQLPINFLKALFTPDKILHPDLDVGTIQLPRQVKSLSEFKDLGGYPYKRDIKKLLPEDRWDTQDITNTLLRGIAETFLSLAESTRGRSDYQNEYRAASPIVTQRGEVMFLDLDYIFLPPVEDIEESIPEKIAIIDSAIVDETVETYLRELGVKRLTRDDVQAVITRERITTIQENWEAYDEEQRLELLQELKHWVNRGYVDGSDLTFLTVKTREGQWISPDQVVFPSEYDPELRVEKLIDAGLLDNQYPFLSTEFLRGDVEERLAWYDFFTEIGVNENIRRNKNQLTERIGVEAARCYETEAGRTVTRLPKEEEEEAGYDIEAGSGDQRRVIEARGTTSDERNIELSGNQLMSMLEHENYYLYLTTNALQNPTLHIFSQETLKERYNSKIRSVDLGKSTDLEEEGRVSVSRIC